MRLTPLLLAAALAAPASAQAPAANPMMQDETRADAEIRAATMFARMDLNHDGVITLDEIQAFVAARQPPAKRGQLPGVSPIAKEMFDDADIDHDGRITADESKAAADRGFDEADTNHDGVVTPDERMAATQDVMKPAARPRPKAGPPKGAH